MLMLTEDLIQHAKRIARSIKVINFRKMYEMIEEFNPKIDDKFTMWVEKIRNAKLCIVDCSEQWQEDNTLIQVKRMSANDLIALDDRPSAMHEFEETLDVFKLPLPIPTKELKHKSEFIFVRPDEYELFIQFGITNRRSILLGIPGISKSWFKCKFILFCYCPNIFNALWKSECIEKVPNFDTAGSEKEDLHPRFFMPEMIVYTTGGNISYLFSIRQDYDVF